MYGGWEVFSHMKWVWVAGDCFSSRLFVSKTSFPVSYSTPTVSCQKKKKKRENNTYLLEIRDIGIYWEACDPSLTEELQNIKSLRNWNQWVRYETFFSKGLGGCKTYLFQSFPKLLCLGILEMMFLQICLERDGRLWKYYQCLFAYEFYRGTESTSQLHMGSSIVSGRWNGSAFSWLSSFAVQCIP